MAVGKGDSRSAARREKDRSPFTPGDPVPVEFFVGRQPQIEELRRYARQACTGRLENVFLAGDRGIGKSSLAHFVRELFVKDHRLLGVHVLLGGVRTLEELVRRVFEELLKATRSESWFARIRKLFGSFITDVGLFGVSVGFAPPKEQLELLVRDFPAALHRVVESLRDNKAGLLLILDDLNGLAEQQAFADWYKSFVDYVAVQGWKLPALMLLCGLPDRRDQLAALQPSLMRIFRVIEVERLSDAEVEAFFRAVFDREGMRVEKDALQAMVAYSSGLPALMHEIGNAAYWADADGRLDAADASDGIVAAAEQVGRKYLDPRVYNAIRSPRYRTILNKLVTAPGAAETFDRQEVESRLDRDERKVFNNFLRKLRELGVIELDRERRRGAYRFVNRMFPVYIYLQSGAALGR